MILLKILAVVLAVFLILVLVKGPREAWRLWKQFGQTLGDWLARIVLTLFYFSLMLPFALVARLRGDPLGRERPADGRFWAAVPQGARDLDSARRQF